MFIRQSTVVCEQALPTHEGQSIFEIRWHKPDTKDGNSAVRSDNPGRLESNWPHARGGQLKGLQGLALLLLFEAAGEALTHSLRLPFPGPVVGLVLLLPALGWRQIREPVEAAAEILLAHLSLLFVPVGVGVITHLDLVSRYGAQVLAVILVSTWAGMAVTALVLRGLLPDDSSAEDRND
jgi:holin-like protein